MVGDSPERRVEILSDHEHVHATWTRYAPHRDGADLHIHRRHTDLFYVLEGELTVRLGAADEQVAVPAGTLVRVPPLVVHGFRNAGDGELRYLNFHAPGERFADYLRAMRDGRSFVYDQEPPPEDGGRPIADAVIGGDGFSSDGVRLLADVDEIAIAELSSVSGGEHVHARHLRGVLRARGLAGGHGRRAGAAGGRGVMGGDPAGRPARGRGFLARVERACAGARLRRVRARARGRRRRDPAAERTGFDQIS